jgi:hypothetical protein
MINAMKYGQSRCGAHHDSTAASKSSGLDRKIFRCGFLARSMPPFGVIDARLPPIGIVGEWTIQRRMI